MAVNTFSYWERTAFIDGADVIIIGSGLVGLSAALHLKTQQPQLKVLVLERGFLPTGASTKNAGFACFGTVSEQITALSQSPAEEVVEMVAYKWRGLQRLRQNLGDTNIDYRQNGGYELFFNEDEKLADNYINRIAELNQLFKPVTGAANTYAIVDEKIAGFGFNNVSRLIYNPYEGQIDTGKMMRILLHKVYTLGVMVLNNCDILELYNEDNIVNLKTNQGNFKAAKVILATNAFANQLYPELNVMPGRGQVLVTKPIAGLKLKGTYHFNGGYYYFRNINNRVLFGGARNLDFEAEQTLEFGQTALVQKKLFMYLEDDILPNQNFEVDYWWSGIMGFGEDIKPIIKQVEPNIFCAVRCNGMGVAMGSLVGEEVAELLLEDF